MKYFWLDVLLAFVIWQLSVYVYENTTPEYYLTQEVEAFNEDVASHQVISDYHISKETKTNEISQTVSQISDYSRKAIEISVELAMGILSGFD